MLLPRGIPRETQMGEGRQRGQNRHAQQYRDVPRPSHAAFQWVKPIESLGDRATGRLKTFLTLDFHDESMAQSLNRTLTQ
jgi:hypothetical protein